MEKKLLQAVSLLMAVLLMAVLLLPQSPVLDALAEQLSTPTDLTTPAPTEVPKTGKRSGYAVIFSGAKVWTSRQRTSSVGTVTADSYVWIPTTTVNSLTYKIRFDTELSTGLSQCHTYYVLSEDVRWLSDSECDALERRLAQQNVRETSGVLIPVIAFSYRNPPATPKATATPAATATPTPTVTPVPAITAAPTVAPVPIITPSPKPTSSAVPLVTPPPTATPGIATGTDLITPTPTAVPTATPGVATDTDLITPTPTVFPTATPAPTMTPGIATDTDLTISTPAPVLMTVDQMRAALDKTHPDRQVSLWVTCTDPDYANGSRMTFFANVSGYDGLDYTVVWEVDKNDGRGYVNAGLDGMMSVSFIIDDENAQWHWRAGVSMPWLEAGAASEEDEE